MSIGQKPFVEGSTTPSENPHSASLSCFSSGDFIVLILRLSLLPYIMFQPNFCHGLSQAFWMLITRLVGGLLSMLRDRYFVKSMCDFQQVANLLL